MSGGLVTLVRAVTGTASVSRYSAASPNCRPAPPHPARPLPLSARSASEH